MKGSEIVLELNDVNQLLIGPDSLFYGKRNLNREAEEIIIEEATMATRNDYIQLKIHLRIRDIGRKDEVIAAIHQHFKYRRKKSEWQLKQTLHLGWKSLFGSMVLFAFLIFMTLIIMRLIPEGRLSLTFREILIILGWVALWRPADLLLYEWRPIKREVNLFRKIEQCKVEVVAGNV